MTVELAGQLVTSGPQLVTVMSLVEYSVMVCGTTGADDTGETSDEEGAEYDAGVMTLVEIATEDLEMTVELAGQFVTSGPQLVTVYSAVE
jgi:hypothetical protein